jgi:hypothetical protein
MAASCLRGEAVGFHLTTDKFAIKKRSIPLCRRILSNPTTQLFDINSRDFEGAPGRDQRRLACAVRRFADGRRPLR